jgi:hypothetical protein
MVEDPESSSTHQVAIVFLLCQGLSYVLNGSLLCCDALLYRVGFVSNPIWNPIWDPIGYTVQDVDSKDSPKLFRDIPHLNS